MDVQQLFTQCAQLAGRGRAAVDPAAALALQVDGAAQQQRVRRFKPRIVQPTVHRRLAIKLGADLGTHRALSYGQCVRACPGSKLQCIYEDRFAGAGFASEHSEPAGQVELKRVNDDEIAQEYTSERHGQATPSFQCSFWRSVSK